MFLSPKKEIMELEQKMCVASLDQPVVGSEMEMLGVEHCATNHSLLFLVFQVRVWCNYLDVFHRL